MFTTERIVFVVFFILCFVVALVYSYRKDKKTHKAYYQDALYILIGFILFLVVVSLAKNWFKNM